MSEQNKTPLPWLKMFCSDFEEYHEALTPDEFYCLFGEALVAWLNGNEVTIPPGASSGFKLACAQLRKKVEMARRKYEATKEDGAKGGKKKAENARKKAAEAAEKGIYTPPKKTQFLTLCKEVLQEYGRDSEWDLPLSLKQESRPGLFVDFCEDQKRRPMRDEKEVEAYILCHAAANWWYDNSENGDDQCYRIFDWLYDHRLSSADNAANALQHMDLQANDSVRFGLQKDDHSLPDWYDTAEDFLAAFYAEDEEESPPEDPPAAPKWNPPGFPRLGESLISYPP